MASTQTAGPDSGSLLQPGTAVQITWTTGTHTHRHRTLVADLTAEAVLLQAPTHRGVVVRIDAGRQIELSVRRDTSAFHTTVAAVGLQQGPPPLLRLRHPEAWTETSQRDFFRVDVDLPVRTSAGPGRLTNLSGGGCLLALDTPPYPEPGATLELTLALPDAPVPLTLAAVVVRVFDQEGSARFGLSFRNLDRRVQDRLVRYVASRQREMLRLGLLRPSTPEAEAVPLPADTARVVQGLLASSAENRGVARDLQTAGRTAHGVAFARQAAAQALQAAVLAAGAPLPPPAAGLEALALATGAPLPPAVAQALRALSVRGGDAAEPSAALCDALILAANEVCDWSAARCPNTAGRRRPR